MSQIKKIRQFKDQKCQNHNQKVVYIYFQASDGQSKGLCIKCIGEHISDLMPIEEVQNMLSLTISQIFQEVGQINMKNEYILTSIKDNLKNIKKVIQETIDKCISTIEQQLQLIIESKFNMNKTIDELLSCDIGEVEMYKQKFKQQLIDYQEIKSFLIGSLQNISMNKFIEQNQEILNNLQIDDQSNRLHMFSQISKKINPSDNQLLCQTWKCLKHQQQIIFLDMNEQETIPNRIACIDCVPENFIKYTKLEKIYENWQQFTIILESSIRQIQDNYNCNKIEKIQLLQNLKNNCNLFLDQEISVLNSCSIEILESKSQYISLIRKDWQSLTQEEIIQIANILSQTNSFEKIIKKIECEILQDIFQQNEIIENQFKDGKQQIIEYFQKIQLNQIKVKQLDQQLMEKSQLTQRDQVNLKKQINYQLFCSIEDEEINSLEFNKENSLLVTGYNSGIIRVYEFQQSNIKLIQELNEHDEFVCCLQFMHKQISFLSGSLDCSIIIWKVNNQQQWYSSQRLVEHTGCINCIISNFNEDLILSCSFDNTIKCWIQDQQSNWICHQSLNDHSSAVSSLSLNESQNQFISSSNDKTILIYQQQQLNDQLWILKQIIQVEQLGFRLCFINDKLFTFQKQYSDYLDIYELKNKEFTNTIQVSVQGIGECWLYFSQKFIKSKNILINKNGCFLNILQLNDTGQFFNVQQIKFKTNNFFGGISGDGEFLITWDDVTSQIQIRILNEHSLSST